MSENITENEYLGGRIRIRQPQKGYRAGVDPVLLAASVPARSGQSVLELGLGVGTAALCLSARVDGLSLTGVEIQSDYAALARENASLNAADLTVVDADLAVLPDQIKNSRFDHVIANPPYFDRNAGHPAGDLGRNSHGRGYASGPLAGHRGPPGCPQRLRQLHTPSRAAWRPVGSTAKDPRIGAGATPATPSRTGCPSGDFARPAFRQGPFTDPCADHDASGGKPWAGCRGLYPRNQGFAAGWSSFGNAHLKRV